MSTADTWKRRLGPSAWAYLMEAEAGTDAEDLLANVLTRLGDVGVQFPEQAPTVTADGLKALYPQEGTDVVIPTLTVEGLIHHLEEQGAGWFAFRVPQFLRGVTTPLLGRFQEFLAAYASECAEDGVSLAPETPEGVPHYFVGGLPHKGTQAALWAAITIPCPDPQPPKAQVTVKGPGHNPQRTV